jgi:hypothetical protein
VKRAPQTPSRSSFSVTPWSAPTAAWPAIAGESNASARCGQQEQEAWPEPGTLFHASTRGPD